MLHNILKLTLHTFNFLIPFMSLFTILNAIIETKRIGYIDYIDIKTYPLSTRARNTSVKQHPRVLFSVTKDYMCRTHNLSDSSYTITASITDNCKLTYVLYVIAACLKVLIMPS